MSVYTSPLEVIEFQPKLTGYYQTYHFSYNCATKLMSVEE